MDLIHELPQLATAHSQSAGRPLVTLCYAQSLDGSITARRGSPLILSGEDSFRYVHRLRAASDGILVGIGTVLADNPRLTVRLVEGKNPQPIILDSRLRFPLTANLLQRTDLMPWIITTEFADIKRQKTLEAAGAHIFRLGRENNNRIPPQNVLDFLHRQGMHSLMIEGGARVITSFMQARLADYLVLTLVPVFVGGLRAIENPLFENHNTPPPANINGLPQLSVVTHKLLGQDLVITGRLV